jgi:hypothetical protein
MGNPGFYSADYGASANPWLEPISRSRLAARRSCQPCGCTRPAEDKTDRFTILKDWFTSLIDNRHRR